METTIIGLGFRAYPEQLGEGASLFMDLSPVAHDPPPHRHTCGNRISGGPYSDTVWPTYSSNPLKRGNSSHTTRFRGKVVTK